MILVSCVISEPPCGIRGEISREDEQQCNRPLLVWLVV